MISCCPVYTLARRMAVSSASVPLVVKKLLLSLPGVSFASRSATRTISSVG
jgi:hypothetical protein